MEVIHKPSDSGNNSSILHTKSGEGRIVGGEVIAISEAPYQVSLQYHNIHQCGGSIISTTFVLSAAHCVHLVDVTYLTVRYGTDQLGLGGEVIGVKSARKHPKFNHETISFDFSLLQLLNEITLQPGVKEIIPLPSSNDVIKDDEKTLVTGWGETKYPDDSRLSLHGVVLKTINQLVCKQAYHSILTKTMVCAGDIELGGIDACQLSISPISDDKFVYSYQLIL